MPYLILIFVFLSLFTSSQITNSLIKSFSNSKKQIIFLSNTPKIIVNKDFFLFFTFNPPSNLDSFEVILSSEQLPQLHLGSNFRFFKNKNCFTQKKFTRTKSLSRTYQKYQFQRKSNCKLKKDKIIYSSYAPTSAFTYPLTFHFFDHQKKLLSKKSFPLKIQEDNDIFLNCQMIRKTKVYLHCSGLDSLGNSSNNGLLVQGGLEFTNQTIDQVIFAPHFFLIKNPKDFMRFHYHYKGKNYISNALPPKNNPIYFGDLHTHSMYSDSRLPVTPHDLFQYGKNVSALDFMAITDHAEGVFGKPLNKKQWLNTIQQTKKANQANRFSAFLGFEWTSTFLTPKSPWGHRTIIYPNYNGLPYRSDLKNYSSPKKLYKATGNVFSFPHHSMIHWGSFNYKMGLQNNEKAFEVFSSHGSSEDIHTTIKQPVIHGSLHEAIKNTDAKFSILAASDTHAGHPGLNDWYNLIKPSMLDGGGLTAVFSKKNNKKSIYQNLMDKKFYATSGTRIILLPNNFHHPFPLKVYGTHELHHIKIISFNKKGHKRFQTLPLSGKKATIVQNEVSFHDVDKYYLQIKQKDNELAWIGPYFYNKK
ncbi:MAG: hypothetical protein COB02_06045 [Candidatus Cloacimonadota bacterium]|nr:MAG: hypothetical protein COB02_12045 [Candidatus Cloacimonadota bacterium]PCJ20160.1 MAG: hypothetical protein COB02_06045 [Candidatus Cloacimonadota bacterium]